MAAINWTKTENFYDVSIDKIIDNTTDFDWIGYFNALGWIEGVNDYSADNTKGYVGIYQYGSLQLDYINFVDGLGAELFGDISLSEFKNNPVAQEIANLMSFTGIPDVGEKFTSRYTAVRNQARDNYDLPVEDFNRLIGKEFTINYLDNNNNVVGSHTVTFTQSGLSAAAHLVGADKVAEALSLIYSQTFNDNDLQTSTSANLTANDFADGNNVAFSTYALLLQDFDISTLIATPDGAGTTAFNEFSALLEELITFRKDNIIDFLVDNGKSFSMTFSDKYKGTIESILNGLEIATDEIGNVDGNIVVTGGDVSKSISGTYVTENSDLVFGLRDSSNLINTAGGNDVVYAEGGNDVIDGGDGNDYLDGGTGKDTYLFEGNFGNDTIVDSGNNTIVINGDAVSLGINNGSGSYKSVDGKYTFTENAGTLTIDDGSGNSITLQSWLDGDFGIKLVDPADEIIIDSFISGDGIPVDTDSSEPNTQYEYDEFGNIVLKDGVADTRDRLLGNAGNNEIFAGALEDVVRGYGGNDIIHGGTGEDSLNGMAGNDLIEGGADTDTLWGSSGNDRIFADSQSDLNSVFQSDTISAGNTRDWLAGDTGDDLLVGSTGGDLLSGGAGNDILAGGAGDDYIMGDSNYVNPGISLTKGDNGWVISEGDLDWTVTKTDTSTIFGPTFYTPQPSLTDSGKDIIYG